MTYAMRLLPLVLALVLAACGDGTADPAAPPPGPPAVATVRVVASAPQLRPGDSLVVSAEARDARGAPVVGAPISWQWSDSSALLGTVEGGVLRVRGGTPGEVQVTARSGTVRGTLELSVRYPAPVALRFPPMLGDSLVVGAQPSVGAFAVDSLGRSVPGPSATVTSSDTTVATVRSSSAGPILTALRPGRTEVVATLGALRVATTVRVWPAPRYLWPDTSALLPGITRTLRAQERPDDSRATVVPADRWRSSAPEVATVSATGVVTAVAPGRATVSAVSGGDTLRALVVVRAPGAPVEYVDVARSAPCALARDGGIYCWGSNEFGQLGTTEVMDRCESFQPFSGAGRMWYVRSVGRCSALPVRVQSGARFVAATGIGTGVCGLTDGGSVECWGLVPTAARSSPVPVPIAPGLRVAQVDGRCLLTTAGEVHCWGDWTVPIFEDGTRASQTPQRVPSPVAFRQIAAGGSHLCGVTAADVAHCWGSARGGAVGVSGSVRAPGCFVECEPRPRQVEGLPLAREVRVTSASSCALDFQGVVRCWGTANENGRRELSAVPAPIPDAPPFARILGGSTPCGLTSGGATWCWGGLFSRADGAQVLSTERATRAAPDLALRTRSVDVSASCGITTDGVLYCFGPGGLLGDGVYEPGFGAWRVGRVVGQR